MSKEIETKTCGDCNSVYKLIYDTSKSSGYSKFCPFCGGEMYLEEEYQESEDE